MTFLGILAFYLSSGVVSVSSFFSSFSISSTYLITSSVISIISSIICSGTSLFKGKYIIYIYYNKINTWSKNSDVLLSQEYLSPQGGKETFNYVAPRYASTPLSLSNLKVNIGFLTIIGKSQNTLSLFPLPGTYTPFFKNLFWALKSF